MAFSNELSQYASTLVSGLVDHPDDVRVEVTKLSSRYVVEIRTSVEDIGQVIGRGGSVIKSVRALVEAFGGKSDNVVTVDYPTENERPPRRGRPRH